MRSPRRPLSAVMLLAGTVAALAGRATRAAEPPVVAVVGIDGYADVKQQLAWVGQRVGNPQLAALAESFVMMATQFKGLAGLDPQRPAGLVVTAAGEEPVVHGYVPVKDLGRLLDAMQGVIGPVEPAGDKRLVRVPGGLPLEIVERDGWAIIALQGSPAGPADAERLVARVATAYSVGVELFPAAMPPGMRDRLKGFVEQATEAAAARGQPMDAAAIDATLAGIAQTEGILFGVAVDVAGERVFVEQRSTMLPGSSAAAVWAQAGKAENGLGLPAAADGRPAAIRGHHAQAVPPTARPPLEAAIARALPADAGDPVSDAVFGLVRDLVTAMLDSGGFAAGVAVETAGVSPEVILPAITLATRIGDGRALERKLKDRFADPAALPPEVTVAFDTGTAAGATLHEVTIDVSSQPGGERLGGTLEATLAVSADRAYLLLGGDVARRVAAAVAAGRAADPDAKPLSALRVDVPAIMAFAGRVAAANGDLATAAVLEDVAAEAADTPSTALAIDVEPTERGVAMRLSAEAGAIETIAAAVTRQVQARGGRPAATTGGGPVPAP